MKKRSDSPYIVIVTVGDPVSFLPLRSAHGVFDNYFHACDWAREQFEGTNTGVHIDMIPINKLEKVVSPDSNGKSADILPFKKGEHEEGCFDPEDDA
tara:strand:+ start:1367 stop:1657 length:291 start_codon:yes stop_codon:yes gene_type:complete